MTAAAKGMEATLDTQNGVPRWFSAALAHTPEVRQLTSADGLTITYRAWGDRTRPGLILIHGAGASSRWWDHIAPHLPGHRVVALDLSGHGDSGHRPAGYDVAEWAAEVSAVAVAEALDRPVLVGHSLGGRVAVAAAIAAPERFSRVVLVDTPSRHNTVVRLGNHRVYACPDDAIQRFRTLPEQPNVLDYIRGHIARHSLRPVRGGWTWKFDPRIFSTRPPLAQDLPKLTTPVALVRCEHGMVPQHMADEMTHLVGDSMPVIRIPGAGHHPMLDRPLALAAALRRLLRSSAA
ncbi:alpha/beta fold hydrolase [Prauserella oleivorans]|uniref:Alpha/beta fold hydrolase n=1 Tax=Prauserella oleivorans TaxID=1478153 RepID=A0ABW5W3B6_9PSEU